MVVTRQELDGLMAGLVASHEPPEGRIALTRWIAENAATLGAQWASEIGRNYERDSAGSVAAEPAVPADGR